jgi:hypothetical protein
MAFDQAAFEQVKHAGKGAKQVAMMTRFSLLFCTLAHVVDGFGGHCGMTNSADHAGAGGAKKVRFATAESMCNGARRSRIPAVGEVAQA